MQTRNDIRTEIDTLSGLGNLVETFEQIAATRITRTRGSVLVTRSFLTDLNRIFQEVKASKRKEIEKLLAKKKIKDEKKFAFIRHNGKTLYVFISSNTGLYGDIVKRTFQLFSQEAKRTNVDTVVIGKVGHSYLKDLSPELSVKYFDFPDNTLDDEKLKEIVLYLVQYEKVVVFYGQFQNIITQNPIMTDISGNPLPQEEPPKIEYLFEPSVERILEFFEKEMFAAIFEQTIKEAQLAKFSSRMVVLDKANEKIKQTIRENIFKESLLRHRDNNKKQLQTFSSMRLWKKYAKT